VDVDKNGHIGYEFVEELQRELSLLDLRGPKTANELAGCIDREIEHKDITHAEASLFLRRIVESLLDGRGLALEQLVRNRFRLRDAARDKIAAYRAVASRTAYRQMLLPDAPEPVEASPQVCFTFPLNQYPAITLYQGPFKPRNHYYAIPADMNDEEAACAAVIDSLPEVKYWVRNLVRDGYSFWLPTSTDKFYPDFVALLKDGRCLVVEYKAAKDWSNDDSKEKRTIGELWAERSKGRCLFIMPKGKDFESIRKLIA
jgi:type III restriction enzyme